MFMRYVHTEDDPVRAAAEAVTSRRQGLIGAAFPAAATKSARLPIVAAETTVKSTPDGDKPPGFDDGNYTSLTKLGNYRPFRHRRGPNRAVPPRTRRTADDAEEIAMSDSLGSDQVAEVPRESAHRRC